MSSSNRENPRYPRFPLEEYKTNTEAIKRVNDAALDYLEAVCFRIQEDKKLIDKQNEQITKLQQIGLIDLMQPLFLLIGSVLLGFGINLATTYPHEWYGWLISFTGSAIQLAVIFISLWVKLRR